MQRKESNHLKRCYLYREDILGSNVLLYPLFTVLEEKNVSYVNEIQTGLMGLLFAIPVRSQIVWVLM